jgi:two-component system LytT family sensor kinase
MIVSGIWLWPALFNVVQAIGQSRLHGDPPPELGQLLFAAGDWLIYAIVTPAIFRISARWPIARPHVRKRVLIHVAFGLLFCVVWAVAGKVFDLGLNVALHPDRVLMAISAAGDELALRVTVNVTSWILTTLPFGMVVYTTVAGVATAIAYHEQARAREVQLAKLGEQLAGARYAALQAQVNPHFLFNTLNTIAVLVRDGDRSGAVRIVEQLSDLLRRTLSRHRANEVPLGEEFELVRQYIAIEQARFSDRLRPTFDVDPSLYAAAVPGFALQHLVENAVRHGIARRPDAGAVHIAARRDGADLVLTVRDDGPGVGGAPAPVGRGLANTRERIEALYGGAATLTLHDDPSGGAIATLRLPFREMAAEVGDVAH